MVLLPFIFAGGIGNLIDRIFRDRHVIDFMNLGSSQIGRGIFNVADAGIPLLSFILTKKTSLL
jgi:signal peptidase II